MCGKLDEHNQDNSDPNEQCILQNEFIQNNSDREDTHHEAALTCNRKVHDINSSLDNTYFENIICLNREKNFEEYVACLGPKNDKKNKTKK